ncbi:13522_t:CDS:2 [Dentiscutata erythropus]|uniref:13522_t:CDS:1 n=1 Tax=Dentiscutata erythropus TaxID=1348616 RepID=A0A9N9NJT9_9GLOM|nr:13522_t:CDS:2 [Dentiscutata erythropus]
MPHFSGKEVKYGYAIRSVSGNNSRVVNPPKLSKIRLTPSQTKFKFYGTRGDILKWMEENSFMIVEYDDTSEDIFSPPSSPRTPVPSPTSSSFSGHSSELHKITFDLFGQQIENTPIKTNNTAFYRPLHFAMNHLPWLVVILEIRPSDPVKDLKYDPVKRVILNSGITLGEAAKALEKSWKSILPDNCPIRNRFSSASDSENWRGILSDTYMKKSKSASTSDNEKELTELAFQQKYHNFLERLPKANVDRKRCSISEMPWIKRRDKSPELIPKGILHPYNMEEALSLMDHDNSANITKEKEAEKDKEKLVADLPLYENVYNDVLLERGPIMKDPFSMKMRCKVVNL